MALEYCAFGSEVLLSMGGKQISYTHEQRGAAVRDVISGMAKPEAMAKFGIKSRLPRPLARPHRK